MSKEETPKISFNQGLIAGLIFGFTSLILTNTFLVPILTMLPSAALESIFQKIYVGQPFSVTGLSMLITLTILLILVLYLFRNMIVDAIINRNNMKIKLLLFLFMSLQSFLIHPLFFYLSLSSDWSKANDGQLLLGVVATFPISSVGLLLLGYLLDYYVIKKISRHNL